jgi:anti-anti-sigma factor
MRYNGGRISVPVGRSALLAGPGQAGQLNSPGFVGEQFALSPDSLVVKTNGSAGGPLVFALRGDFDISCKQALSRILESSADEGEVTIDLSKTTFLDASTLAILAKLQRQRGEKNASTLRVIGANPHIRKILSITKLDQVFDVS